MKVTITNEHGKTAIVDISKEEAIQLNLLDTGYERLYGDNDYYYITDHETIGTKKDDNSERVICMHAIGNYFTDIELATDIMRFDRLYKMLRQFQAMNDNVIDVTDWEDSNIIKYVIKYDYIKHKLYISSDSIREFGSIYFNKYSTAKQAMEKFYDDLEYYFLKCKSRLDG